jgi:hypothetical protein
LKLGFENKTQTGVMILLLVVAVYLVGNWYFGGPVTVTVKDATSPTASAGTPERVKHRITRPKVGDIVIPALRSQDPTLLTEIMAYSESMKYTGGARNIFQPLDYVADNKSKSAPDITDPTKIEVPAKVEKPQPTIPLRFYGYTATSSGLKRVFFTDADGQDIFIGQEGDLINKRYKIVRIKKESVDVFDVINHFSQNFPMPTALGKNAFN